MKSEFVNTEIMGSAVYMSESKLFESPKAKRSLDEMNNTIHF